MNITETDIIEKNINEFEEKDCNNLEVSWQIRLDSLKRMAYKDARSDVGGNHPLGTHSLDMVFEEIDRLFRHYTVIAREEGFRDQKIKNKISEKNN